MVFVLKFKNGLVFVVTDKTVTVSYRNSQLEFKLSVIGVVNCLSRYIPFSCDELDEIKENLISRNVSKSTTEKIIEQLGGV